MEHTELTVQCRVEVLALDFDGVICDSRHECLELSLRCFAEVSPDLYSLLAGEKMAEARSFFLERRGLVRPARNFYLLWVWAACFPERRLSANDFEAMASEFSGELVQFETLFFGNRAEILANDPEAFVSLNPFYSGVVETWKAFSMPTYIVSTKDSNSIELLLRSKNISVDGVFGFGPNSKRENIAMIIDKHAINPEALAFVDDNPLHLRDVAGVGIQTFWASWGYGPEDKYEHPHLQQFADIAEIFKA